MRLADAPEEMDLPCIENLQAPYHAERPMPAPVGFGPIQAAWQQRLVHAGTYDASWRASRAPLVPSDFSNQFYQAAPPDQVYPEELRGGEPVSIYGMRPEGAYSFQLPKLFLRVSTKLAGRWTRDRLRQISVILDGTEKTVDMVWNAHLLCTGRDHRVEASRVILLKRLWGERA